MMAEKEGWERLSEDELKMDRPENGKLYVIVYRKPVAGGHLIMTVTIHDRRAKLGKLDLSTKLDRLLSVQATTSVTYLPDT